MIFSDYVNISQKGKCRIGFGGRVSSKSESESESETKKDGEIKHPNPPPPFPLNFQKNGLTMELITSKKKPPIAAKKSPLHL